MATQIIDKTPEIVGDFEGLQRASDRLFTDRAKLAGGMIGQLFITDYPTTNRPEDDPTLIENVFTPAIDDPGFVDRLLGGIKNSDEVLEQFWGAYEENGLARFPQIAVITPHPQPYDLLGVAALSLRGELGSKRSASNNYIPLSMLIPYIVYQLPVIDKSRQPREVYKHIATLGNLSLLYPQSESVDALREKYKKEMSAINRSSNQAREADRRPKLEAMANGEAPTGIENQIWDIFAPSASKSKVMLDSQGVYHRLLEPVSRANMRLLSSLHRSGVPIMVLGLDFSIGRSMLSLGKQVMSLGGPYVILPTQDREKLNDEEFDKRIKDLLLTSAKQVSKIKSVGFK